jgi:hypothetical protein
MSRGSLIDVLSGLACVGMVATVLVGWRAGRLWAYHFVGWGFVFAVGTVIALLDGDVRAAALGAAAVVIDARWAWKSLRR